MQILSLQHIGEAAPRHIITACEDTDTCPSCGAGYKVGLSACEYCRTPVRASAAPIGSYIAFREDGTAFIKRFATGGMVPKDMLACVHQGEAIVPRMIDERFRI